MDSQEEHVDLPYTPAHHERVTLGPSCAISIYAWPQITRAEGDSATSRQTGGNGIRVNR